MWLIKGTVMRYYADIASAIEYHVNDLVSPDGFGGPLSFQQVLARRCPRAW